MENQPFEATHLLHRGRHLGASKPVTYFNRPQSTSATSLAEVYFEAHPSKHKMFFIIFVRRRPHVFDVGLTLYKWYKNVLCLLG